MFNNVSPYRDLKAELERACQETPDEFPRMGERSCYEQFDAIEKWLNQNIHPHVEKGATLWDGGFLTDHGVEHIQTVIRRAGALTSTPNCQLTPYEIYLLLTAIHFHDVGNIYGRENHEKKSMEIMEKLGPLAGDDDVEKKVIIRIASAHGGDMDGDRDTISYLPEADAVSGKDVRFQLLAAILRFADELAEDKARAHRYPQELGVVPRKCEVYHKYAALLNSVMIKPHEKKVDLHFFVLNKEDAVNKFGKGRRKVFLLDEIFERTLKSHLERIYCMRFMATQIQIDKINVEIEVYRKNSDVSPVHTIKYTLREKV